MEISPLGQRLPLYAHAVISNGPQEMSPACYRPHKREAQHALRPPGFTFQLALPAGISVRTDQPAPGARLPWHKWARRAFARWFSGIVQ